MHMVKDNAYVCCNCMQAMNLIWNYLDHCR